MEPAAISRPDPETVTISGYEVDRRYGPHTVQTTHPDDVSQPHPRIGEPGQYPFTRGIHEGMYRTRLWTMRQFAGFGSADDTNRRFKYLLENARGTKANTGLSTAFDLPTLMGRDSDDPLSAGEVGRCGVAIDTIEDMERLYADIPLDKVTVSQTINGPAAVIWAMYLAMARRKGFSWDHLGGTLQNDILKEFHSQNEFIYPPEASVKLVVDTIEHQMNHVPRWNSVSVSGYHIREAGSTAVKNWLLPCATAWSTSKRPCVVAWMSTILPHDCLSSSTPTMSSLKRSAKYEPPEESGPPPCVRGSAPNRSGLGGCVPTSRLLVAHSQSNSH